MNIFDAYLKFKKQNIIIISGFPGCNKTIIGNNLSLGLKFILIKLSDFLVPIQIFDKPENYINIENVRILDWDNIYKSIDWDKFNKFVESNIKKNKGIIIIGFGFPNSKINFKIDFHIHIKIFKDKLKKIFFDFLLKNPEMKNKMQNLDIYVEKILIPYNNKNIKESTINKFINQENIIKKEEEIIDYLISKIEFFLEKNHGYNKKNI